MNKTSLFLQKLYNIADQLGALNSEYDELYEDYNGTDFAEQNHYACETLCHLIQAVTHEYSGVIGFMGNKIDSLTKFIDFRKKYCQFTSEDLAEIIDNEHITTESKLRLAKNQDLKTFLNTLKDVKKDWNITFGNKKYSSIKEQIK